MRYTPVLTRRIVQASRSGDALLAFVVVTHPHTPDVIRLVLDGRDYLIDGEIYHKSWYEIGLLDDTDKPPQLHFRFPNVDRRKIALLRKVSSPPRVELCLTTSAYFNTALDPVVPRDDVDFEWSTLPPNGVLSYRARSLFITDTTSNSSVVEGTCRSWDYRQEQWPSLRARQSLLPGTYAR